MEFSELTSQYLMLAGYATFVAVFINLLKEFGVVKDGQAKIYSAAMNLIGLTAYIILRYTNPEINVAEIDTKFGELAMILINIFNFAFQVGVSKAVHNILAGTPLIGKSYSSEPSG